MNSISEDTIDIEVALGEINVDNNALDQAKANFETAYAKVTKATIIIIFL